MIAGIWGTVWLELVPAKNHIIRAVPLADLDSGTVSFTVTTSAAQNPNQTYFQLSFQCLPVGNSQSLNGPGSLLTDIPHTRTKTIKVRHRMNVS